MLSSCPAPIGCNGQTVNAEKLYNSTTPSTPSWEFIAHARQFRHIRSQCQNWDYICDGIRTDSLPGASSLRRGCPPTAPGGGGRRLFLSRYAVASSGAIRNNIVWPAAGTVDKRKRKKKYSREKRNVNSRRRLDV